MIDIIERLRSLAALKHDDLSIGDEAADEIESLRQKLAKRHVWASEIVDEATKDLRQQLAECQAREKVLVDRLDKYWDADFIKGEK